MSELDQSGDPLEQAPEPTKGTCRALILSPIDAPAALAAGLQLVGNPVPVIKTNKGSAAFIEVKQDQPSEEDELMALLGEDRPIPEKVASLASLISKMAAGGSVALTSWTSAGAEGVSGTITARRFVNGKPEEKLSSGLVLAKVGTVCEDLLLGVVTPEQAESFTSGKKWSGFLRGPGFRY